MCSGKHVQSSATQGQSSLLTRAIVITLTTQLHGTFRVPFGRKRQSYATTYTSNSKEEEPTFGYWQQRHQGKQLAIAMLKTANVLISMHIRFLLNADGLDVELQPERTVDAS